MKVMIAGAPAAGKGTQSLKIVETYGLEHICVGDLLRAEIASGTDAGTRAKEYMNRGELVPNEIVVDMVKNNLLTNRAVSNGWLLDGYPRSLDQAEAIEKENIRPDIFLLLNVPDEVLVERVVGRRLDPETGEIYHLKFKPPPTEIESRLVQRFDDTEEKIRSRLNTYHSNLDAILDIYKDVIVEIDGQQEMDAVFKSIKKVLVPVDGLTTGNEP
eukprot:g4566.t1